MTDISRYKNVSLTKDTYQNLDKIRKLITPHIVQSRSGTINILVNKETNVMRNVEESQQVYIQDAANAVENCTTFTAEFSWK